MSSLLDIPALTPLGGICQRFGIHFEVFGGFVTRLFTHLHTSDVTTSSVHLKNVDMFAFSPPSADIELSHSGSSSLNAEIRRLLLATVPASECFRWDVRSRPEWQIFRLAVAYNNHIPTRLMSLSSDPSVGFADPFGGQHDIRTGIYRYERNPLYPLSPLHRTGVDLEFSSALLFLKGLLESPLSDSELLEQDSLASVTSVLQDARSFLTIAMLQRSAYLRARIRYLLFSILAAPRRRTIVDRLFDLVGLKPLLGFIRENEPGLGDELKHIGEGPQEARSATISSSRLHGDVFRTAWFAKGWVGAGRAAAELQEITQEGHRLGDGESLVLASPEIPITVEKAPSAGAAGHWEDDDRQEFLYFNIDVTSDQDTIEGDSPLWSEDEDEEIALLAAISIRDRWAVYPLPGRVKQHPGTHRVVVGLNALGLLHQLSAERNPRMRLFLSAWRPR